MKTKYNADHIVSVRTHRKKALERFDFRPEKKWFFGLFIEQDQGYYTENIFPRLFKVKDWCINEGIEIDQTPERVIVYIKDRVEITYSNSEVQEIFFDTYEQAELAAELLTENGKWI